MDDREIAGYRFKDESLLNAALTHGSYLGEHPGEAGPADFERLEFLGDSVLNVVVADDLYRRFPEANEGELTEKRARIVSKVELADAALRSGSLGRVRLSRALEERPIQPGLASRFFEAVLGAIYLDGGLTAVRKFVRTHLAAQLRQAASRSSKSLLQEFAQSRQMELPIYSIVGETIGPTENEFVAEVRLVDSAGRGVGRSKKEAEEAAAADLLAKLS